MSLQVYGEVKVMFGQNENDHTVLLKEYVYLGGRTLYEELTELGVIEEKEDCWAEPELNLEELFENYDYDELPDEVKRAIEKLRTYIPNLEEMDYISLLII